LGSIQLPTYFSPFGEFYALVADAFVDRDRVAVFKALDHHEQHGPTSSMDVAQR
jgi:hypothetical protein